MTAKTILVRYYVLGILFGSASGVITAMYAKFLVDFGGLDYLQLNLVNVMFFSILLLGEVPTGIFADRYGRRPSFVIATLLFAVGMFLYGCVNTFSGFLLAEAVSAVGASFASGAFESWLVDSLDHVRSGYNRQKVFARYALFRRLGTIPISFVGAFLFSWHAPSPWFVGGGIALIACFLGLVWMKEDYRSTSEKRRLSVSFRIPRFSLQVYRDITQTAKTNGVFVFCASLVFFQFLGVKGPDMQWQLVFGKLLSSDWLLGFVWAGIAICLSLGNLAASRYRPTSQKAMLAWLQIVMGLALFFCSCAGGWVFLLCFGAFEFTRGMFGPVQKDLLHSHLKQKTRAAVTSLLTSFVHAGSLFGLLLSGVSAKYLGIETTWAIAGAVLAISGIISWFKRK